MSKIEAYGLVLLDTLEEENRLVCGVADGGIGIQTSLLRNPLHEEYGHYECQRWNGPQRNWLVEH